MCMAPPHTHTLSHTRTRTRAHTHTAAKVRGWGLQFGARLLRAVSSKTAESKVHHQNVSPKRVCIRRHLLGHTAGQVVSRAQGVVGADVNPVVAKRAQPSVACQL